jgi:predicted TIM-barrel fold metal-dependent hydrolase
MPPLEWCEYKERPLEYRVISTDNHINEAPDTWTKRLPAKYVDRAPKIMPVGDGGDGWSFDGQPPKESFGLNAVAGMPYEDFKVSGLTFDEIMPGNYDGEAHIKDMAHDGVDAAVIYPMAALNAYTQDDPEYRLALIRAYNDWLMDEFCGVDPKRLIGLPLMPVDDDLGTLLAELDRMLEKNAKGVFLPFYTVRPYYDPYYDPFWNVLSENGVAASIHRSMGGKPPATGAIPLPQAEVGLNVAGIVERFFTAVTPFTRLVYTGVFERFPELKFVDAEVNAGWLPFWLQMMEEEYERQRHWAKLTLSTSPRHFVGKNLFVTVLADYVGCEAIKNDPDIAKAAMYSTDYPHSATLYPESRRYIAELTEGMDDATKHNLLAGNAVRVFNLN